MNILAIVNQYLGMIPHVEKVPYGAIVVPAVLALVGLVVAFSGRRLLNLLKFLVCAGAGYYLGSVVLFPYVAAYVAAYGVDNVIVGAVLAVIGAILSKFAYAVVFAGAFGYAAYTFLPTYVVALQGNFAYPIVAAVAVGLLALLFRGLLETVLTSVAGGAAFAAGLYSAIVAVTATLGLANGLGFQISSDIIVVGSLSAEAVVLLAIATIVAFAGLINQAKNRHQF